MNLYREGYQKAQKYAERVLMVKKGRFLDSTAAAQLCIDAESFVPNIAQWYRMNGFRMNGSEAQAKDALGRAVSGWLRATTGSGCSAAFALLRINCALSVLYGAGAGTFDGTFTANIAESDLSEAGWPEHRYAYNGLLTGAICSDKVADVFASSGISDGYLACIAIPLADQEIQDKIEENRTLAAFFEPYKTIQRVYGSASRRVEEAPVAAVLQAIALLREETEYLEHSIGEGFVRTAVRFGANTQEEYRTLASAISSCINYDRDQQSAIAPPQFFPLPNVCRTWRDCLAVPYVQTVIGGRLERLYAVTLQDIKRTSSFCLPPLRAYDGYYVKNYGIDETSPDAFPITRPIDSDGVTLGSLCGSRAKAVIPFAALHAHTFVAGATETGKTTTVKRILTDLHAAGIPFTVIEAAKKEYHSLIGHIPELRVYTPGNDGMPLSINPLQPEDGVLIENHVAAVVRALVAATGGEHPIPEAYNGLLKQTYQDFGWKYGMMAYSDSSRPFPTFRDVFSRVDDYIAKHAQYGPEVRQNLTAALTLRTETMHSGAMGNLFSEASGLQAKDLLEAPCVIELSDFSSQSAAFLMNILLFKFQSFLSRQLESAQLKRVIVIEEAHNIFRQTLSEDSGQALNNEYFDKMLSEIRSSGTGLILSDQRPSIMSSAVIANTAVKIMHALVSKEDREAVGLPGNLTEFQLKKMVEFKIGECVTSIRGYHGVQHAMVDKTEEKMNYNSACHICTSRFRCRKKEVRKMLSGIDPAAAAFHVSKIQANPYHFSALESNITNMLQDLNITASSATKTCLLGEILDEYGMSSMQERRIITASYANYLKRRNTP